MSKIINVKCEHEINPIGIDSENPVISYNIKACCDEYNIIQKSYRIIASNNEKDLSCEKNLIWDTGIVCSKQTVSIVYQGESLISREIVYYKIFVELENGENLCSEVQSFEMGLMSERNLGAYVIRYHIPNAKKTYIGTDEEGLPSPYMRKEFYVEDKPIEKARVYATALGMYNLHLNGRKTGDFLLAPGWMDFNKVQPYQTYDITDELVYGKNAISAVLGDGWYAGPLGMIGREYYGGYPLGFLCQIEIFYQDGTNAYIRTDGTWKATKGPIVYSDMFSGEYYDARKELGAWDSIEYDDSKWDYVDKLGGYSDGGNFCGEIISQVSPPVKIMDVLNPKTITKKSDGAYRVDMGQNMVGWSKTKLRNIKDGQEVKFVFAEALEDDDSLYRANLRRAKNTDYYIGCGKTEAVFEPHFTFRGFRYVDIYGLSDELSSEDIQGIVIHSSFERKGYFKCSDERVNRLYENNIWSQKGNMIEISSDCPQRDERWGCCMDTLIYAQTACYNMDMSKFFRKLSIDIFNGQLKSGMFEAHNPHVGFHLGRANLDELLGDKSRGFWYATTIGIIIPYTVYKFYGDLSVIKQNYHRLDRYMDYCIDKYKEGRLGGIAKGDLMNIDDIVPEYIMNCNYIYWALECMAEISGKLGFDSRKELFENQMKKIKKDFAEKYINKNTGEIDGDSQTGYAVSLRKGLLDADLRAKAVVKLANKIDEREKHLSVGCMGLVDILQALTDNNHNSYAYDLLLQDTWPSWLYQVDLGATTMWERWDGYVKGKGYSTYHHEAPMYYQQGWSLPINSLNHFFLGSMSEWFYSRMGGISQSSDSVAFEKIIINPNWDKRIKNCEVIFNSASGEIKSKWYYEDEKIRFKIKIPANTSADIQIPLNEKNIQITIGEKYLEKISINSETANYKANSGVFEFIIG